MTDGAATKRWLGFALKAVVTAFMVWLVLRGVDLSAAVERMADLSPSMAVLAVLLLLSHCFVAGLRWRMIMGLFGPVLPAATSVRLFLEGYFFNNALPSTIGGDGVRVWRAVRRGLPIGPAINGVLLDRITGFAGLFILVVIGQPLLWARVEDTAVRLAFGAILLAGVAGIAILIMARRIPPRLVPAQLRAGLHKLSEAAEAAFLVPRVSQPVLGLAVVVHGLIVLSVYVIAVGLGLDFGFLETLVLVPAVILLSTVPISIGGWGLREGLMVVALGIAGVPADAALTVSILFGLAQILAGIPGGVLWLMGGGETGITREE